MTKKRAYILALLCIIGIFALAVLSFKTINPSQLLSKSQIVQPGFYKVTQVYDGDTIAVDMNGTIEKVRMIGVDTPETHKPNTPVQCYGPEASDYTKNLLNNSIVRLEADPTNSNRDRYGRLLRYVYTQEGMLVDQQLIQQGYGFAYLSFPFVKSKEFAQSQEQAQSSKLGLWAKCQPKFDKERWSSNPL